MVAVGLFGAVVNLTLAPFATIGIGESLSDASVGFFVEVVVSYSLVLAAVWLVGLRRHHAHWIVLGFRPLDVRSLAGMLALIAGVIIGANILVGLVTHLPQSRDLFVFGRGLREIVLMGLLVLVAAPLAEEVFFRGFLLQGLARRLRFWPAAIVSSAAFAVAHIWWQFYAPIFILGLIFAWLFWRTGSLWASIAAHATINGTSLIVVLLFKR
jgi:membrane protease YdiL (CAAX protease family)